MIDFIHIPKNAGSSIKNICDNTSNLIYKGHQHDPLNSINNTLIIIRNPIDRFCSAIRYALQQYSDEPVIQELIQKNITTPSKWIEIMQNQYHEHYDLLMQEIYNKSHYIGKMKLIFKWTYSPQSLWITNPNYVILFENIEKEMRYFCKKHKINFQILKINQTIKEFENNLTNDEIEYLKKIYSKDFELYDYYKSLSIYERL